MLSTKLTYSSSRFVLMFIEMRHCQNCNGNYKKENIVINEIDNTLSDIIEEHKRKFHSFLIVCKINNKKS